jgi:hypothetical protein
MECSTTIDDQNCAPATRCYGTRNVFFDCRAEHTRGFDFNHISSSYNTILYGRFVNSAPGATETTEVGGVHDNIITYYTGSSPWNLGNNYIGVRKGDTGDDAVDRWGIFQNVGIGTFDPQEELHVSASKATIKIEGDGVASSWRSRLMLERNDPERGGGIWINDASATENAWWMGTPYNGGSAPDCLSIGYHPNQPEYIGNSVLKVTTAGLLDTPNSRIDGIYAHKSTLHSHSSGSTTLPADYNGMLIGTVAVQGDLLVGGDLMVIDGF